MALVVPNVGETELLDKMLKVDLQTNEDYTLKLYTAVSPALSKDSVAGDFTEASFVGYSSKTLLRANWNSSATVLDKATSTYSAEQTWTALSTQTLLGYYVLGATSGILLWAEEFVTPIDATVSDVINITPQFTLNSEN
jgi:hypothetical protein